MMETIGKSSFYRLMKSVSTKMGQIEDKTGHEQGILDKIKEEGLLPYFQKLFEKSEELNKKFTDFMTSVKTFGVSMTNIVSYAFILPILDDIISIANSQNVEQST